LEKISKESIYKKNRFKMKNLFSLLLTFFVFGYSSAQSLRDSVLVTGNYTVCYSEVLEQPEWVKYKVLCPNGKYPRTGMNFYTVPGIKTSDNADYEHNEWDKGHMAPAADFNCDEQTLRSTFSYLNSALQQQSLNRGPWKALEMHERKIAEKTSVEIYIDIEFKKILRVPTGAAIPTGFYKEISYQNKKECFYFPNTKPALSDFTQFKCNCRN
jgi:endonuclease G